VPKKAAAPPNKLIAFGWYGGKYSHLDWLLPLLPEATHFCDVFGGSAAVIINRKPSLVETYNDIDGELVNFFRVLRENKEQLIEAIGLTPFSREELRLACMPTTPDLDTLERARRFYVRARQVRTGLAQTASIGRWAHCVLTSRAGMAGAVSRWLGAVEDLPLIAQRLLRVQIECDSALAIIDRYDSEETLFYCDPPYVHDSQGDSNAYAFEMNDNEHRELSVKLKSVSGKVALSGYHSQLYDELYGDWYCTEGPTKLVHSTKSERTEVLWTNYRPVIEPFGVEHNTIFAGGTMEDPGTILNAAFLEAQEAKTSYIADADTRQWIEYIVYHPSNRAPVRLLLACALAKTHQPGLDARKPYTEIGTTDAFSGRTYDEAYITALVQREKLPCNPTTAFLTPVLRNHVQPLMPGTRLEGRPKELYQKMLVVLDVIGNETVKSNDLLKEILRLLIEMRDEQHRQKQNLLSRLSDTRDEIVLSSEMIVKLLAQHLDLPYSSRLPVLMVMAAYRAAPLGETPRSLTAHNAADKQTGALGDLEILLINQEGVVTSYEMKTRQVDRKDIDLAVAKVEKLLGTGQEKSNKIQNYIFITTEPIDPSLIDYCKDMYHPNGCGPRSPRL
jgi:DNA adenine methylase